MHHMPDPHPSETPLGGGPPPRRGSQRLSPTNTRSCQGPQASLPAHPSPTHCPQQPASKNARSWLKNWPCLDLQIALIVFTAMSYPNFICNNPPNFQKFIYIGNFPFSIWGGRKWQITPLISILERNRINCRRLFHFKVPLAHLFPKSKVPKIHIYFFWIFDFGFFFIFGFEELD